ncbi:MAG: DUF503 family protein, partial [Actinomycetota bacterium]
MSWRRTRSGRSRGPDHMFVGVARFELRLPGCTSLKEKRSALRGLTTLIKQKFNA